MSSDKERKMVIVIFGNEMRKMQRYRYQLSYSSPHMTLNLFTLQFLDFKLSMQN